MKFSPSSWRQPEHRHLEPRLPPETGLQTSPVAVGLQSDWGCNSGHLFMETDLHGKWLIKAAAWIIVRFPHPNRECLGVYYLLHKLNPKRFVLLCVGHFCFILRMQLPLLPTPRGSLLW